MAKRGRFKEVHVNITSPWADQDAKEIVEKYKAKGYDVRIIRNIWGNTKVLVRKNQKGGLL